MPPCPKFDRETKVLLGVWTMFMLWVILNIICQRLLFLVPALRASIASS